MLHFTVDEIVADGGVPQRTDPGMGAQEEGIKISGSPSGHNSQVPLQQIAVGQASRSCFCYNQELFAEHYHRRSQVETAVLNGQGRSTRSRVRGKTRTSQANNGVLCKLLANNLYVLIRSIYELGLEPAFEAIGTLQNPAK